MANFVLVCKEQTHGNRVAYDADFANERGARAEARRLTKEWWIGGTVALYAAEAFQTTDADPIAVYTRTPDGVRAVRGLGGGT